MSVRLAWAMVALVAATVTASAPTAPLVDPVGNDLSGLWVEPVDLPWRDLFAGQWGDALAPDPDAVYTYVGLGLGRSVTERN